jgi:hypothetical protein
VREFVTDYWPIIEPLGARVDFCHTPEQYEASRKDLPHEQVLIFAAHTALAEVHEDGFVPLFWNPVGILVPEAIDGLVLVDMPQTAAALNEAAFRLGEPYPRDRNARRDALLAGSGGAESLADHIFRTDEDPFVALRDALGSQELDRLALHLLNLSEAENGGFPIAAGRFLQSIGLSRKPAAAHVKPPRGQMGKK